VKKDEPPERVATFADITTAIERLTQADGVRLEKYAAWRIRGIPAAQIKGRDWGSLLTDAVTKTLEGDRQWKMGISFVQHLVGVMRSTSSHWAKEADPDPAISASRLERLGPDGEVQSPYLQAPDIAPNPEQVLLAKETLDEVRRHFKEDWLVSLVIDALGEGHRPSDLQELGVSANDVQAALKKLRRHAREMFPRGGKS